MKSVSYVNHEGRSVRLSGEDGVWASPGTSQNWQYEARELNGLVSDVTMDARTFTVTVGIACATEEEACAAKDALADCLSADSSSGEPGALWVGEWHLPCLPMGLSNAATVGLRGFVCTVTFRTDSPWWVREAPQELAGPQDSDGLDFPADYPLDYCAPAFTDQVRNASPMACPCRITVQGPAAGWYVVIGANRYSCDAALAPGESLTIDGDAETITVKRADGTVDNAYATMAGDPTEGSGTFVFQPVEPGFSPVSWGGCPGVAVTVLERRVEPKWGDVL